MVLEVKHESLEYVTALKNLILEDGEQQVLIVMDV
jgi:hypothetical protein